MPGTWSRWAQLDLNLPRWRRAWVGHSLRVRVDTRGSKGKYGPGRWRRGQGRARRCRGRGVGGPAGFEPATSLSGMIKGSGGRGRSGEIPYGTRGFTPQRLAAFCIVFGSHVHASHRRPRGLRLSMYSWSAACELSHSDRCRTAEATREGELAEIICGVRASPRKRSERNESGVAGKARQDEPVDGFADRPGEELDEAAGITAVGTLKRAEVAIPLLGSDDHRRVVGVNELPVGQQPSDRARCRR